LKALETKEEARKLADDLMAERRAAEEEKRKKAAEEKRRFDFTATEYLLIRL